MDEEDIEYFHEDLKKVDKIEGCKQNLLTDCRCNGDLWSPSPCIWRLNQLGNNLTFTTSLRSEAHQAKRFC